MVGGFHNDDIAERVCMAPQTVRNYISRIYDKLQTTDRVAAGQTGPSLRALLEARLTGRVHDDFMDRGDVLVAVPGLQGPV